MYSVLLMFHVLAATIWTGGHIVLCTVVLPKALKKGSPQTLLEFESVYEKVGMPALITLIITGSGLAYQLLPDVRLWFAWDLGVSRSILLKLILLSLTVCLALNARFRVIPMLSTNNLLLMAWHIISVTILSILFVVIGVSFRAGWFL